MANILTTEIEIYEGSGTETLEHSETLNGSPASYNIEDLSPGQLYTMRARVNTDEDYTSEWSTLKTFTTMINPGINSLTARDGYLILSGGEIEYNPDSVTPTRLQLLVSKNSGGSDSVAYDVDSVATWNSGSYSIKGLDQNTTYYVVGRVGDSLQRTWQTPWKSAVSVNMPYLPAVITIAAPEISYTSVTASVQISSVAVVSSATVSIENVATEEVIDSIQLDTSKINGERQEFLFVNLEPDTEYRITVKVINVAGPSNETLNITTLAQQATTITITEFVDITPTTATANITYGSN